MDTLSLLLLPASVLPLILLFTPLSWLDLTIAAQSIPEVGNLFWAGGCMKIKILRRVACYFVLIIQNSRPDQTIKSTHF